MEKLTAENNVYRSLGRMYIKSSRDDILTQLGKDKATIESEIARLQEIRNANDVKKQSISERLTKAMGPAPAAQAAKWLNWTL